MRVTTTCPKAPAAAAPPAPRFRDAVNQRRGGLPAWVLLTEVFIGLGWLRAATEKLVDPSWWRGDVLAEFLAINETHTLAWYKPFIDLVVAPRILVIALLVFLAQLFVAGSLISGRFLAAGLAVGMFLNLNFLAAGAVNPSAFYLLSQGALALWLAEQVRSKSTLRILTANAVGAGILALISIPFISTLDPARVIDDPALMMTTSGVLAIIACDVAHRNLTGGKGLRLAWSSQGSHRSDS